MARFISSLFLLVPMSIIIGCGGNSGTAISGKVSFDGVPLDQGTISFVAASGAGRPEMAPIQNGGFSMKIAPGAYKVQVSSEKPVPPTAVEERTGQKEAVMRQFIPAKYRGDSTELSATVENKPGQVLSFELKSAK